MRKLFISVLAVVLGAALIYGATMAWFTDTASVAGAEFKAGTVIISTGETVTITPEEFNNVNPGDTFDATWTISNDGTKAVMLRVLADIQYVSADGTMALSTNNIGPITLSSGWTSDGIDQNPTAPGLQLVLYYTPVVLGSLDDGDYDEYVSGPRTLTVTGTFDGDLTTNAYQGSILTINGSVQAIQASHSEDWDWSEEFPAVQLAAQTKNHFMIAGGHISSEFIIKNYDSATIDSIKVDLFSGSKKLATNEATMAQINTIPLKADGSLNFSTPFYLTEQPTDGYWVFDVINASGLIQSEMPTKAVLTVTDIYGGVYAVETTQVLNATAWANLFVAP